MRRRRYSRRSSETCSLRDRPVCSRLPSIADALDQLPLDETRARPRPDPSRTQGSRRPRSRMSVRAGRKRVGFCAAEARRPRRAPRPTPGCPSRRLRTVARSNGNDDAELERGGIGLAPRTGRTRDSPSWLPFDSSGRPSVAWPRTPCRRFPCGRLDRQAPDLDEAFSGRVIEPVARVVGRESVVVEREGRLAPDDTAVALEELQADGARDALLARCARTRRWPRASG